MPAKKKRVARRAPKRLDRVALKKREIAIIADLKTGLLSYRKIADKHGVSLPTVNAKARKAKISRPRGRRPSVVPATAARRPGRPAKTTVAPVRMSARGRKPGRRVGRPARATTRKGTPFADAFREMVLRYYPSLTLKKFDRLSKMINKEMS